MFFDGQIERSAWQRSFDRVGEDFFDPTGKLAVAHSTDSLPSEG
jgi:hypothetical protein